MTEYSMRRYLGDRGCKEDVASVTHYCIKSNIITSSDVYFNENFIADI